MCGGGVMNPVPLLVLTAASLLSSHVRPAAAVPSQTASRSVSNEDIRDAILSMVHMFRDLSEKLERHELRERTLGDQLKRALSGLDKRERAQDSKLHDILSSVHSLQQRLDAIDANQGMADKDVYTVDTNIQGRMSEPLHDSLASKYDKLQADVTEIEAHMTYLRKQVETGVDKVISAVSDVSTRPGSSADVASLVETSKALERGQADIQASVEQVSRSVEKFYSAMTGSYAQLSTDMRSLPNIEKILVQTADNVMDTKRRVEYGVHQFLMEVGELVKSSEAGIVETVNTRFNDISVKILENQNRGLTNLSSKVETEVGQVWRQIGIMYQQLSASAGTLDSLQKQTETYVNGSLSTMDGMENKVGLITSRMNEVDENLNYLLGRLSLVTQEFSLTKSALSSALDNIRSSFKEVKTKVDPGPGPNAIPSDESVDSNNV